MTDVEIRDRLKALEVGAEHRDTQLASILKNLDILVADLHERRGREAVIRVTHVEDREDKFQLWTWMRAALPAGLWVGIYTALYRFFTGEGQ